MVAPPAVRPGIKKNVSERLFEYTQHEGLPCTSGRTSVNTC